jgi:phage terminase large subunit-like protein
MTAHLDIARALDPALIASDCGLQLDPWQKNLMRSTAPRVLMLCSRQVGKSTTAALIAVATAIMTAGALVLLVSPSQRQSGELFKTVMRYLKRLLGAPRVMAESALRCELENGSRIIALPGEEKTVRGYSGAALIIIDEAARVEDELLAAVRPMLATSNGTLIGLSTPAGKRGWFYEAWHGDESWHRVRVPASECPRISAEFLREELRELGQQRFSEEYELAWLDATDAAFSMAAIDAAFSSEVRALWR